MDWELEGKTHRDVMRDILMFNLKNIETNEVKVCGVTRIAINDHFHTEDTMEQAEINFEENSDRIIEHAIGLIEQEASNERGYYVITSAIFD